MPLPPPPASLIGRALHSLGLSGSRAMSGAAGAVSLLPEGQVAKLTTSFDEAALCWRLMALQAQGEGHPAVPAIHNVMAVEASHHQPLWLVIREDFRDYHPGGEEYAWFSALTCLNSAWYPPRRGKEPAVLAQVLTDHPYPALQEVLDGLFWVEDRTGYTVMDAAPANVGVGQAGLVGMRDFSHCLAPDCSGGHPFFRSQAGGAEMGGLGFDTGPGSERLASCERELPLLALGAAAARPDFRMRI